MVVVETLKILFWSSVLIVFLFYAGYSMLLFIYNSKRRLDKDIPFYYPTVSLIVPVYKEEKIISKKLQNINETDYPSDKIEVIIIDGNSNDRTSDIVLEESQKSSKPITLIRQTKRNGYTGAVIDGIEKSKNEVIIATDAASYYYPDAIKQLVRHFQDHKIGAVTGREVVMGKEGAIGPQLEKSYRFFYDFMRVAETEMDSTPDSKGEILAVRREICLELVGKLGLSPNASFDSCVPYQAKLMGYRTIYDETAAYYETAPSSISDRMTQQVRRATLLIGAMLLFKGLLLKPKAGKFGLVIFPAHFIMSCIIPTVFVIGLSLFTIITVLDPLWAVVIWVPIIVALLYSKTRTFLISFTQSQFALIRSLFSLASRKESLFIETIPSTRADV